jgi:hypothetical protein
VRHQAKWRAKFVGSSTTNSWIFSSDPTIEEEVTRLIDRNRAKTAVRKGKTVRKEDSISQSESSFTVSAMMSTLKRLNTSFAKAQLWKQWNKSKDCSTANMNEELKIHCETLQLRVCLDG